jgi:hypothetical protein
MKRLILFGLAALLLVSFTGCEEQPPPPEPTQTPPKPPEPTAEEIHSQMLGVLRPLGQQLDQGQTPSREIQAQAMNSLQSLKQNHQMSPNGQRAISMLVNDLQGFLQQAEQEENWRKVLFLCEGVHILDPGNALVEGYEARARTELNRPKVTATGYWVDKAAPEDAAPVFFMKVTLPPLGLTLDVQAREGETITAEVKKELWDERIAKAPSPVSYNILESKSDDYVIDLNLEFIEIRGRMDAIRLKYTPTGQVFEVPGPKP